MRDHRVKFNQAQRHWDTLKTATEGLLEGKSYASVIEHDKQTGENIVRITSIPKVPIHFSAIAGDILFNFRSSLDHCVFALSVNPPPARQKDIEFPIFLLPDGPNGYATNAAKRIRYVPIPAQARSLDLECDTLLGADGVEEAASSTYSIQGRSAGILSLYIRLIPLIRLICDLRALL